MGLSWSTLCVALSSNLVGSNEVLGHLIHDWSVLYWTVCPGSVGRKSGKQAPRVTIVFKNTWTQHGQSDRLGNSCLLTRLTKIEGRNG